MLSEHISCPKAPALAINTFQQNIVLKLQKEHRLTTPTHHLTPEKNNKIR
jgi:hypothetical protein